MKEQLELKIYYGGINAVRTSTVHESETNSAQLSRFGHHLFSKATWSELQAKQAATAEETVVHTRTHTTPVFEKQDVE